MTNIKIASLLSSFFAFFVANYGFSTNLLPEYSHSQKEEIYAAHPLQPVETFLSYQTAKDLDVSLLAKAIDRTKFASGSVEFSRLMQPTDNMKKLERRRQILLELLQDDSKLFYEFELALQQFTNKHEALFISLLDGNVLPEMSVASQLTTGIFTGLSSILSVADSKRHIVQDRVSMKQARWYSWLNLARGIYIEFAGGLYLAYLTYGNLNTVAHTIYEVDEFVLRFADALVAMEKINKIILSSPILAESFPVFSDFKKIGKKNEHITWTLEKLESRAQAQDTAWVYWHMKDSIMLYDSIRNLKNSFAHTLWWVARIDAYMSVIRWIKEKEAKGEDVTFINFNKNALRPHCHLQNLTNPTIANSVGNDFDIDGHAVFTGPHALGKTSSMRSIAYAHIMAQSILVVPAKTALLVPVSNIKTYFNVGDSNGESSFQAELRHMTELLSFAEQNKNKQPMLFLIDEPFAKTPSLVGNQLIERFLNKTVDIPNLSMLLSTHLEVPSRFVDTRRDIMQNLQPEIKKSNETFVTTYKIIPGAADWWFENKNDQTNAYVKWLIRKQQDAVELWFN